MAVVVVAAALLVAALFAAVGGRETLILAAETAAHVASASVVWRLLRYDGSQMAVGTAGSTLKSWKGNLVVISHLLAEISSGKKEVHVHGFHGGLNLWDVVSMISWVGHRWSGGRMNASHNPHGACVLWKRSVVGVSNHHGATYLHLGVRHSHGRCV